MRQSPALSPVRSMARRLRARIGTELNHLGYNLQRIDAWGPPQIFQIELTNECPMTCAMCPRTALMRRDLGYMDEDLFRRIVDEIAPHSEGLFLHHFGDSLVHPGLAACVAYAAARGIRTYLSANPVLLTRTRAVALLDAGLHELVLSLDGLTPETSAAVRGPAARNVEAAERRILEFLELRRQRESTAPRVILQIVRQRQNQHEVGAWLRKWSAVDGIDRIKVKSYVTWDGQDETINALRIGPGPDSVGLVCDKPWSSVTVLWDGRVVPCCFDYDGLCVLGNLRTQRLCEIWNGAPMRALRRAHRDRKVEGVRLCRSCTDKEGYPVTKWYYPLNRVFAQRNPLGGDETPALMDAERRRRPM